MKEISRSLVFGSSLGFQMGAAKKLAAMVLGYDAVVTFRKTGQSVYADDKNELLDLRIKDGEEIKVQAVGEQAREAVDSIFRFLSKMPECRIQSAVAA